MLYVFATDEVVQVGNWDWRWFSLRLVFLVGGDLFRKQDESVPLLTINQKYLKIQFSKNYNQKHVLIEMSIMKNLLVWKAFVCGYCIKTLFETFIAL